MLRNSKQFAFVAIAFAFCSYVSAQQMPAGMMARQGADTTKKPSGPSNGLKSYKEIITSKSVTDVGFFNVHKVDSKYYAVKSIDKTSIGIKYQLLTTDE